MESGEQFHIKPFESRDQAAVRQLVLTGLGEHFGYIDETLNPDLDDIQAHYIEQGHTFLVAWSNTEIIGAGALINNEDGTGEIVRVSTHPGHRRKGVAQALIRQLLLVAQQRGDKQIYVATNNNWQEAITLYQRCGFVEQARSKTGVRLVLEIEKGTQ